MRRRAQTASLRRSDSGEPGRSRPGRQRGAAGRESVGDKLLGDGGGLGEVAGFQLHGHPPDSDVGGSKPEPIGVVSRVRCANSAVAVSGVVHITDQPRQRCGDSVVAACLLSVQHVTDPAAQDIDIDRVPTR